MNLLNDQYFQKSHFLIPIWRKSRKKIIEHIGTGWLASFNEVGYIITAAHVLDALSDADGYIFAVDKFLPISNTIIIKSKLAGSISERKDDPVDIGAIVMNTETFTHLSEKAIIINLKENAQALDEDYLDVSSLCRIIGFPETLNKKQWEKFFHKRENFSTHLISIVSTISNRIFPSMKNFSNEYHIAVDFYSKDVSDASGKKITPPKMNGISGGLVFESTTKGSLASGMIIEYNHQEKVFVAIKMQAILEWFQIHIKKINPIHSN